MFTRVAIATDNAGQGPIVTAHGIGEIRVIRATLGITISFAVKHNLIGCYSNHCLGTFCAQMQPPRHNIGVELAVFGSHDDDPVQSQLGWLAPTSQQ